MLFFINSTFNQKNSGIEHAQLKRAALFRKNNEAFKLVFREWNPNIHRFLGEVGISNSETLCMFDYFQKAELVEEKVLHVEDLDFGVDYLKYNKETKKNIPFEVVKLMTLEQLQLIDKIAVLKNYVVFNSELIENLSEINLEISTEEIEENEISEIENCENFIAKIIVNGNLNLKYGTEETAYYSPKMDYVMLPKRQFFISTSKYYSTLFHEVIHWTGHESRLNRNLKGHADKESYSFEELIAEMGAILCSLQFGIFEEFINSVRYLKGWASANSLDRETAIRKAFTESKKAKKFLENL